MKRLALPLVFVACGAAPQLGIANYEDPHTGGTTAPVTHAHNDDTLEQLWRFNLGTPLKGAPVTYQVGSKQYVAVQTSGRHLHPVKFDNLENSSYLFVFAVN